MMTTNEEKFWADGGTCDQISNQVSEYIAEHRSPSLQSHHQLEYRDLVSFGAYPLEDEGENAYTNNLNEVAVEGCVQFRTGYDDFFGGKAVAERKNYESKVLENPTWLELCLLANDMINCTGDYHHIFLEGIHKTGQFTLDEKSFILLYDFSMGS